MKSIYTILFLTACIKNSSMSKPIGAVDTVNGRHCSIQLDNEKIIFLNSELCNHLTEGDTISIIKIQVTGDESESN